MLNSVSISRKIAGAFGLVFTIAAAAMAFVFVTSQHVSALSRVNERVDQEQSLAAAMENALIRAVSEFRGFEVSGKPGDAAAYRKSMDEFSKAAIKLQPMLSDPNDVALFNRTRQAAEAWHTNVAERTLSRLAPDGVGAAVPTHTVEDLVAGVEALRTAKHEDVERSLSQIDLAAQEEDSAILAGGLAMLIISIASWLLLRAQMGTPVIALTGVMKRLASGENAIEVDNIDRGDEIGDMARAVLVFRDNAVAKEAAERAKAIADAEQKLVVDTLADGLSKLSQGDLTAEIEQDFPANYSGVRANFNSALGSLRTLIGSVMLSTETIRTGSAEIAEASESLALRTQSNAASLEQTTAAMHQMSERFSAGAENSSRTTTRADRAIETVDQGRSVTDGAVQAMTRVAESAQGIDDVIEGLDKIAFQTRVLAMNAAVEAGRAGEAGRGFAVVADLVSALAMRAEEEAKRARDQLTATQNDIATAVDAVRGVDTALAGIATGVIEVHQLVGRMASDNRAQALTVSEINGALTTMDLSTQQNAAMVEETSAASRTLNNEVRTLAEQTSRFRVERPVSSGPRPAVARSLATVH